MSDIILKKDGNKWLKFQDGKLTAGKLEDLLKTSKYYILKEEDLK